MNDTVSRANVVFQDLLAPHGLKNAAQVDQFLKSPAGQALITEIQELAQEKQLAVNELVQNNAERQWLYKRIAAAISHYKEERYHTNRKRKATEDPKPNKKVKTEAGINTPLQAIENETQLQERNK